MIKNAVSQTDVHWAGEAQALEALGEKKEFVTRLISLGYRPDQFRVTVCGISRQGPHDRRTRYNVIVDQLRNGEPYRGKSYLGGYPENWINQFAANARTDFPHL